MLQQAGVASDRIRTCTSTQVPHTHGAHKYSNITTSARTHSRYIADNVSSGACALPIHNRHRQQETTDRQCVLACLGARGSACACMCRYKYARGAWRRILELFFVKDSRWGVENIEARIVLQHTWTDTRGILSTPKPSPRRES
jgi:hypothetical protein